MITDQVRHATRMRTCHVLVITDQVRHATRTTCTCHVHMPRAHGMWLHMVTDKGRARARRANARTIYTVGRASAAGRLRGEDMACACVCRRRS